MHEQMNYDDNRKIIHLLFKAWINTIDLKELYVYLK